MMGTAYCGRSDMAWTSLISHLSHEDPEQLLANPYNWRIHEQHQKAAMEAALEEIGWAGAVIVNDATGNVVDGHMRVDIALRAGAETVPVLHINATEEQERLLLATYDPIGALAVADREKLKELSAGVKPEQDALRSMLQDLSIRYRDKQVSEGFQQFIDNAETEGDDEDDGGDDGGAEEDDGDGGTDSEGEMYYPISYSVTAVQRTIIQRAIAKAKADHGIALSVDALTEICRLYLA